MLTVFGSLAWAFCRFQEGGVAMTWAWPTGLGAIIAIVVLLLAIVFMVLGRMDLVSGSLIAALAVARLT
jgi:hypothetical protein